MFNLANKTFLLVENRHGHAAGNTAMTFGASVDPLRAIYSGPNIVLGQAIVKGDEMLYHAVEADGALTAGRATVSVSESDDENLEMRLQWQWLTGERSSGLSIWRQASF